MSSESRPKKERLRAAAIVKLKYELISGRLDEGFRTIYEGVLEDLSLSEEEVDRYIDENKEELTKFCLGDRG
jgi:hypothetical protein